MDVNNESKQKAKQTSQPQSSLHEVRTAENSAAFLLSKLHELRNANPALRLLDVGCGSGTITTSFAKLIPAGHVTGIDINEKIIPRARTLADEAGINNVSFQTGSALALPFEDESFDVVFCHQVLIHLQNPINALREMMRVTKKGGVVAAREGDYESEVVVPELEGLKTFHGLMAGLMGTPSAGRELVGWAMKAGAVRDGITFGYRTSSYVTTEERRTCAKGLCEQLRSGALRAKALKADLASEDGLAEMARAWEDWMRTEDASLGMLQGEIVVQK